MGWRNDGNMENQGRSLLDFGAVFVCGIREVKSGAIVSAERNSTFAGFTSFRHPSLSQNSLSPPFPPRNYHARRFFQRYDLNSRRATLWSKTGLGIRCSR